MPGAECQAPNLCRINLKSQAGLPRSVVRPSIAPRASTAPALAKDLCGIESAIPALR